MSLWNLKYMGRLVVRLKAIKYNKDSFYYLSFQAIHQVKPSSHMLLGRTIWPSLSNAILSFLIPSGLSRGFAQWIMPPSFAITLMPYILPKPQIQYLSQQSSRASFLLSLSQVDSNDECLRATLMQPAFLVEELNRY